MVVSGQLAPIEKLESVEIDSNGRAYTIKVEGAKPFVKAMIDTYASIPGAKVTYTADGAVGRIVARFTGPGAGITEVPLDRIALKTSEMEQPLYLNKRYVGLHPAVVKQIRQTVADGTNYSDATGEITQAAITYWSSQGLALELYDWIVGGTDSFKVCVRTITRTRTVSPAFNRKIAQDDMEKLFTPQQLAEYLGSAIPFTVPTLTLNAEEIAKGLVVAWRKFMCDCDDTATGQGEMVEAWQLAKWAPHYDVKGAA